MAGAGAAAAGSLPLIERWAEANPLGMPIGSQTYPHKQRIQDGDFAGLCADMQQIGVGQPGGFARLSGTRNLSSSRTARRPGRFCRTTA